MFGHSVSQVSPSNARTELSFRGPPALLPKIKARPRESTSARTKATLLPSLDTNVSEEPFLPSVGAEAWTGVIVRGVEAGGGEDAIGAGAEMVGAAVDPVTSLR